MSSAMRSFIRLARAIWSEAHEDYWAFVIGLLIGLLFGSSVGTLVYLLVAMTAVYGGSGFTWSDPIAIVFGVVATMYCTFGSWKRWFLTPR